MIKSISALAIFVALCALVIALPGFAPAVKADEAVALPKADRLPIAAGNCVNEVWPNIAPSCLRETGSGAAVHEVRLVTARR
ncbi:MAG: hypothetical protein ACREEK_20115 [Bradyrhizobium sp.]